MNRDDLTTLKPRYTGAPSRAAQWAGQNQGRLYDWQSIGRYLLWILPSKASRGMCSEVCATMLGVPAEDAHLFDPRVLRAAVKGGF